MKTLTTLSVILCLGFPAMASADATADLWKAKCANCHGEDGRGQTKMGKKMKVGDFTSAELQKKLTDADIKKTIAEGVDRTVDGVKKKMEAYKGFTPEQIDALLKHIRDFAAKAPPAP